MATKTGCVCGLAGRTAERPAPGWVMVAAGVLAGLGVASMLGGGVSLKPQEVGIVGAEGGAYLVSKDNRVFHLKGNQSFLVRDLPGDWR